MSEPELLLAHRDFVRALASELLHDRSAIDDVEQETMLAAWQRRELPGSSPRGWIATVARNFARQLRRGDDRRHEREQAAAAPESIPSVADVVEREERRRAVVAAVLALAEPYRAAVLLRFYEELPPREIARRLGVPVETARTRVKRGVELVRARLLEGGAAGGDPASDRRALVAWLLPLARPRPLGLPIAATWSVAAVASLLVATLAFTKLRANGGIDGAHDFGLEQVAGNDPAQARSRISGDEAALAIAASRTPDSAHPSAASAGDAAAAAAPSSPRSIRGRVVDARAAPIAGARVFAWPDAIDAPIHLDDAAANSSRPHATSGRDGRFELRVPTELDHCTLFATAADLSPGTVTSVTPSGGESLGREVTIVLEDNDALVGSITDARGEPIARARVRGWGMHGGALLEHATTSGADGSYRLPYPSSDRAAWQGDSESWCWWVEASADGFAPRVVPRHRNLDPDVQAGETRLDLVLLHGTSISGRVIDAESGAPIADARVVLVAWEWWTSFGRKIGGELPNPYGIRVLHETRSDEAGLLAIADVPSKPAKDAKLSLEEWELPQMMQLFALAPGYATGGAGVALGDEGATTEITLRLWRPATITGRVVDGEGRPVAGVRVTVFRRDRTRAEPPACVGDPLPARVRTDESGRFEIGGVPARAETADLFSLGVDDASWNQESACEVAVRAGETVAAPDLVLIPERSVVLEVVDELGAGVAGARVKLVPPTYKDLRTDAAGRLRWFEAETYLVDGRGGLGHREHETLRFRVEHPGFATVVTGSFTPAVGEPPLARIVLARAHAIHGSVVDPMQRPAARAGVFALRREPTPDELEQLLGEKPLDDPELLLADAATDADGTFAVDDLPDLRCCLVVTPPIAWRGRRPLAHAVLRDVPVDGVPITARLADR